MITEHAVQMSLRGRPRWWTVTNANGSREVVRVMLKAGDDYSAETEGAPPLMVLFALLAPGQFKWPPLAAAALCMGSVGWEEIRNSGGRVVLFEEPLGQRLEEMLVGN